MIGDNVGTEFNRVLDQVTQKQPDLVEFRLDRLNEISLLEQITETKSYPAIATVKTKEEAMAKKLLLAAASAGFEFVDVDISSPHAKNTVAELEATGADVIVSFHDGSKTPDPKDLQTILDTQMQVGGYLYKIVTTATRQMDNLSILNFLKEKPADAKLVTFAMGPCGIPSRILSPVFGAEFTFASLTESSKTADGQLTIDQLRSVWQLLGV
jgi:3-dehydroquinate dehydratase type I